MNKLIIPYIKTSNIQTAEELATAMKEITNSPISCNPWPEFKSNTKANFVMAHNMDAIILKYEIEEKYLIASEVDNGKIHNDSCVEFFIAFNDDEAYYNLEFNCLGSTKIGYGTKRSDRELLATDIIGKMSFSSKINSKFWRKEEGFDWEIILVIPKEIFIHHPINSFNQLKARGNFYKCGDGLPEPHFLSWNMITSDQPNFHKTECFGELEFTLGTK